MSGDSIHEIQARWASEGVPPRPGNPPEALAAFETRYGVILPPAFRDYFARLDGTGEHSDDAHLRFWPLAEVEPILQYHRWEPADVPELVGWFYFADFLINSHTFAIRLTTDPVDGGPVAYELGGLFPLAPSFDGFLERYLSDRDTLTYSLAPPRPGDRDDEASLG